MGVLRELANEHRLFRRVLQRIVKVLDQRQECACKAILEPLLLLLTALKEHESVENITFASFRAGASANAAVHAEVEREHARLHVLQRELIAAINGMECGTESFEALVRDLACNLKLHFDVEEKRLWPLYSRATRKSFERRASRRTRQAVQRLERLMEENGLAVAAYLTGHH